MISHKSPDNSLTCLLVFPRVTVPGDASLIFWVKNLEQHQQILMKEFIDSAIAIMRIEKDFGFISAE